MKTFSSDWRLLVILFVAGAVAGRLTVPVPSVSTQCEEFVQDALFISVEDVLGPNMVTKDGTNKYFESVVQRVCYPED